MIPINLDSIISTLTGIASPTALIKEKLQRNETVIRLLKQFNLGPEHPPSDFSGVYAYTLVEYGVGKPKPILELFRHNEVQKVFRKALDQNIAKGRRERAERAEGLLLVVGRFSR